MHYIIIKFNNDKITKEYKHTIRTVKSNGDLLAICCLAFSRKDINSHRLIRLYRDRYYFQFFSSYKRPIIYARYEYDDNNEGAGGYKVI